MAEGIDRLAPQAHLAVVGLESSRRKSQQRSFAGTIRTDQCDACVLGNGGIEVGEDGAVLVTKAEMAEAKKSAHANTSLFAWRRR